MKSFAIRKQRATKEAGIGSPSLPDLSTIPCTIGSRVDNQVPHHLAGKNAQKKYQWKNGEMQECRYAGLTI